MKNLPSIFKNALQPQGQGVLQAGAPGRLGPWKNGRMVKQFAVETIGGILEPGWSPPPETRTLARGWYIDEDGLYTCRFPAVDTQKTDFQVAERHVYPAHLTAARLSGETSSTRFQMSADKAAMKFHHWMGHFVPGFWDVFNYNRREDMDKSFRLCFEGQGEIVFYGTHGGFWGKRARTDEEGALMVVKAADGRTFRLLYESEVANPHRDVCYPGEHNEPHVGFNIPPNGEVADNIITAFAIVRALGMQAIHNEMQALPVPDEREEIVLELAPEKGQAVPVPSKLQDCVPD